MLVKPCCNRRGRLSCLAAAVAGIILAMLLPVWLCFCVMIGLLALICLL